LVVLICKHEFDARYQKNEDRLYIAQLYFPLIGQVCDIHFTVNFLEMNMNNQYSVSLQCLPYRWFLQFLSCENTHCRSWMKCLCSIT
jgi:hypothetical protein